MKRVGFLIDKIADIDNLRIAYLRARRGKLRKSEIQIFSKNLDDNLIELRNTILNGDVSVGKYRYFKIFDPKERVITASSFDERVLHHAIMNVCHKYFDSWLIDTTYATRLGKGQYAAIERALYSMNKYQYVAKLDFRKFFDSINHSILKKKLSSKIKDKSLLSIFSKIIDSYSVDVDCGLPIGNLVSQYFANFYLSAFDHFAKQNLKAPEYIRYMDDILIFSHDHAELKSIVRSLSDYASLNLKLNLKTTVYSNNARGVSFLGYYLSKHRIILNKRSRNRFRKKYIYYTNLFNENLIEEKNYYNHIQSLSAFVLKAYTLKFRKKIITCANVNY